MMTLDRVAASSHGHPEFRRHAYQPGTITNRVLNDSLEPKPNHTLIQPEGLPYPKNNLTRPVSKAHPYTTPAHSGGGVIFWGQSAPLSFDTLDLRRQAPVQFGLLDAMEEGKASASLPRIPNAAHRVLHDLPKTELHLHQSGSTDVELLKALLLQKLYSGEIDKLDRINHQSGQTETINLTNIDPNEMFELVKELTESDTIRNAYRVQVSQDRHKVFEEYGVTRDLAPGASINEAQEAQMNGGLRNYRNTSARINPLVKNAPAAYKAANDLVKDTALENVRYLEYRVSASGDFTKAPSIQNDPALLRKLSNGTITEAERGQLKTLELGELIHWVNDGFRDSQLRLAKRHIPFDYGLIILFERNDTPKKAEQMAKEAIRLRQAGYPIVGVDLAGGELVAPVTLFRKAFQVIKDYNENPKTPSDQRIGITIHAGETYRSCTPQPGELNKDPVTGKSTTRHDCNQSTSSESIHLSGPQSIEQAINIAWSPKTPVRIGHGIQLVNSSEALRNGFENFLQNPRSLTRGEKKRIINSSPLLKTIIDKDIVIEMCPKSNVQTLAVVYHTGHPAVFLSRLGAKITLSSDNRTISNTDTPNEAGKLFKHARANYKDLKKMAINGFDGAFIHNEKEKSRISSEIKARFMMLESNFSYRIGVYQLNHRGKQPGLLYHIYTATYSTLTLPLRLYRNAQNIWRLYQNKSQPQHNVNGNGAKTPQLSNA